MNEIIENDPTIPANISRLNPVLNKGCIECLEYIYKNVLENLLKFENENELLKKIDRENYKDWVLKLPKDENKIVQICYRYISEEIPKIKYKNTYDIYKNFNKIVGNLDTNIRPGSFLFNSSDANIYFITTKDDNIKILDDRNKEKNYEIKEKYKHEFWLLFFDNTIGFYKIDDYCTEIMGNAILHIISLFNKKEDGEKWMNQNNNLEIIEKDYFKKFIQHLTSIILLDLEEKYPNKKNYTSHHLIKIIYNNPYLKNFFNN